MSVADVDEIPGDIPLCDIDACTQEAIVCLKGLYYCEAHGIELQIATFGAGNEIVGPLD